MCLGGGERGLDPDGSVRVAKILGVCKRAVSPRVPIRYPRLAVFVVHGPLKECNAPTLRTAPTDFYTFPILKY